MQLSVKRHVGSNPTSSAIEYEITMLNYIDISTEEKKKEIYDLFSSFSNKTEIYKHFGKSGNGSNVKYINNIGKEIGFDFKSYHKKREDRKCKKCGKTFHPKYEKQIFCCKSCANSFNNYGKKMKNETKDKIRNKIILYYEPKKKVKHKKVCDRQNSKKYCKTNTNRKSNFCLNCGKEIKYDRKYCSNECARIHKHKRKYEDFLNNNEKYCRGNYSPTTFKSNILEEQGGVCAICGIEPIWNGKPLVFVLDHIDGDASNNKRENLRLICPHCDSQLPTFKSKNKYSTRRNYWREKILRKINDK